MKKNACAIAFQKTEVALWGRDWKAAPLFHLGGDGTNFVPFEEDRIVVVLGRSGVGKSLFARAFLDSLFKKPDNRDRRSEYGRLIQQPLLNTSINDCPAIGLAGAVFQEPMRCFNPALPVETQLRESWMLAREAFSADGPSERQYSKDRDEVLRKFEIGGTSVLGKYPRQLSLGELQRLLFAMAFIGRPRLELLVADEPTSSLDVSIQKRILDQLKNLMGRLHRPDGGKPRPDPVLKRLVFITHDISLIPYLCRADDKVIVIQKDKGGFCGKPFLFGKKHLWTTVDAFNKSVRWIGSNAPAVFASKSKDGGKAQAAIGELYEIISENIAFENKRSLKSSKRENAAKQIVFQNVSILIPEKRSLFRRKTVLICKGIGFEVRKGDIFGIVGESGLGKSTIAKAITGILPDNARRKGQFYLGSNHRDRRDFLQLIPQDPGAAFNPGCTVGEILKETFDNFQGAKERFELIEKQLRLSPAIAERFPGDLSGGEKQKLLVARALSTGADVIVADEPFSSLDICVKNSLVDLFLDEARKGRTFVVVSHDLGLMLEICDRIAILGESNFIETLGTRHDLRPSRLPSAIIADISLRRSGSGRAPEIAPSGYMPNLTKEGRRYLFDLIDSIFRFDTGNVDKVRKFFEKKTGHSSGKNGNG